jgi:hypothetical protein
MGDTDRQRPTDAGHLAHCADGHPRARRSREAFDRFVVAARDWADLALRIGECPHCESTIVRAIEPAGGDR